MKIDTASCQILGRRTPSRRVVVVGKKLIIENTEGPEDLDGGNLAVSHRQTVLGDVLCVHIFCT